MPAEVNKSDTFILFILFYLELDCKLDLIIFLTDSIIIYIVDF